MSFEVVQRPETIWLAVGFAGQFFFFMRFFVQWISSERKKESVIPFSFWIFSIAGSILLLSYAVYRKDPVFIIGQVFGSLVYFRNIYFISRRRRQEAAAS